MSAPDSDTTAPLSGLTVIDLTRVLSGPYCTMLLADMGARVIKVEQAGRGDDTRAWGPPFQGFETAYFLSINRNKESITLDLKRPEGRRILDGLLDRADVLVENFRPATMERLELGYETVHARWPGVIYCSISGFGQTGPRRDEPGYDAVVQAEGGLMSITGDPDGPPFRLGVAISDIVAGMFAAQGILLAVLARGKTGLGQRVDIGMLDSTVALLTYQAAIHFATGIPPVRLGNRHPTIVPYETFQAADGDMVLAVGNDEQWRRFCDAAGLEEIAEDQRFSNNAGRVAQYDLLRSLLAPRLRQRTRAEWRARFNAAGVPCGAVRDIAEVLADPQVRARSMIEAVEHAALGSIQVLGLPVKLSDTPGRVRSAPPTLGQHTDEILRRDLGLSERDIAALRTSGIV
ncbi:MAG: CoA transferase [Acidobacteria bacterium]|nr:CoA transferase [Acidobacteriota bacterium]MCA1650683.1 CoA transferase [Acidobacteriota bacterium]